MTPPRLRLQTDDRRETILQAGLRVFGSQTYEATSVEDLAREAGMSAGLLYHYFPGKHALFTAAYDYLAERFIAAFEPKPGQEPWGLIDHALNAYLAYAQRYPGVVLMLLRPARSGKAETAALNDKLNSRIAGLIALGFGIRASDINRRLAIRAWLSFVDRAVLDFLEQGKPSRAQIKALALRVLRAALEAQSCAGRATKDPA